MFEPGLVHQVRRRLEREDEFQVLERFPDLPLLPGLTGEFEGAVAHLPLRLVPTAQVTLTGPRRAEEVDRSEEHTSELQSRGHLVCRLLLEKKQDHTRAA